MAKSPFLGWSVLFLVFFFFFLSLQGQTSLSLYDNIIIKLYNQSLHWMAGGIVGGRRGVWGQGKPVFHHHHHHRCSAGSVNSLSGFGAVLGRFRFPDGHIVQQKG